MIRSSAQLDYQSRKQQLSHLQTSIQWCLA